LSSYSKTHLYNSQPHQFKNGLSKKVWRRSTHVTVRDVFPANKVPLTGKNLAWKVQEEPTSFCKECRHQFVPLENSRMSNLVPNQSQKWRLFIGSPVTGPAWLELADVYEQRTVIMEHIPMRMKWVDPTHWHLTWLFLGQVSSEQAPDIEVRLGHILQSVISTDCLVKKTAFWPTERKASLLIADVQATPELTGLAKRIRHTLHEFPDKKPFVPHITLARLKERTNVPPDLIHLEPRTWSVSSIVLYKSTLTPAGPIYEPLQTYPLL
jgi:2'-5' RNA ligase